MTRRVLGVALVALSLLVAGSGFVTVGGAEILLGLSAAIAAVGVGLLVGAWEDRSWP